MTVPWLIDTDPGIDDALALLLAFASPEVSVEAITSVAGNVPIDFTTANVHRILAVGAPARRPRVARGAARTGIEAGMLRADDYDLGSGLWIVFAGRFDSRRGATRQAADLAGRYPGAYPQLLRPVG